MKRTLALMSVLATVIGLLTATAASAAPPHEGVATYRITVTNLTDGQYLTPPNVALHERSASVFSLNDPASPGVRAVAENGGVPVLAGELAAALDGNGLGVSGVAGSGPLAPGAAATIELTGDFDRLSIVSMLICTNDGFAGLDSRQLALRPGADRTFVLHGHDAGTEINTEARGDLVPAPFCGEGDGSGVSDPELAEDGVVRIHRGITGVGDLDASFDWNGPVASVTVERLA